MSEDISQVVKEMVAERMDVDPEQITDDTNFFNDLQADSLDIAELVIDLEEEFDIQISDEDAQQIQTVGQAANFIKEHKEE